MAPTPRPDGDVDRSGLIRSRDAAAPRAPVLVLFCGLPGSGKTTLARTLESAGAGVRICTDDWQHALGLAWSDPDLHERLQTVLFDHALDLLRHGVDVILRTVCGGTRSALPCSPPPARPARRIEWHVLEADPETLWRRLVARNARAGDGDFPMTRADLRRRGGLRAADPNRAGERRALSRPPPRRSGGRAQRAPQLNCRIRDSHGASVEVAFSGWVPSSSEAG